MNIRILTAAYVMLLLSNTTSLTAQQTTGNELLNAQYSLNCCEKTGKEGGSEQTQQPVVVDTTGTYFIITETLKTFPALRSVNVNEEPVQQKTLQGNFNKQQ